MNQVAVKTISAETKTNTNTETNGLYPKNIGPYTGVQYDKTATFNTPNGERKFRFAIYQAFNAFGLIGSECNGVVIFDEDKTQVVCDEISKQGTGWFGISPTQIKMAEGLIGMSWENFQTFVNNHARTRNLI